MSEAAADMVNNNEKQQTEAVVNLMKKTGYRCSGLSKNIKKRAWSAEEDEKLIGYVKVHGGKNWSSISKEAGLNRSGRSCRLRWLNYLRPILKRGRFSQDEEDWIMRLYNLLGHRWSLIARRLPGRTDNEIKNHWRTNLSYKMLTTHELNLKPEGDPKYNPTTQTSITPIAKSDLPVDTSAEAFKDISASMFDKLPPLMQDLPVDTSDQVLPFDPDLDTDISYFR